LVSNPSVEKFEITCSRRDLISFSARAIRQELGPDLGIYKYGCISILDSIALNAMLEMKPHANEALYIRVGTQAVRDFLQKRPNFLQPESRIRTNLLEHH